MLRVSEGKQLINKNYSSVIFITSKSKLKFNLLWFTSIVLLSFKKICQNNSINI
jgi:hypothetical protein